MVCVGLKHVFGRMNNTISAAFTAIFAKIGIDYINSDFATFIRTLVILCVLGAVLFVTQQYQSLSNISVKSLVFLVLSGLGHSLIKHVTESSFPSDHAVVFFSIGVSPFAIKLTQQWRFCLVTGSPCCMEPGLSWRAFSF